MKKIPKKWKNAYLTAKSATASEAPGRLQTPGLQNVVSAN